MNNTKKITTSAVMAALVVVLSLVMYFLPIFQLVIFIVGIPIVIIGKVSDLKMQLLASAVAVIILAFVDPSYAMLIATLVLVMAVVQGYCFNRELKNSQNILFSTLAMVFGFLGFIYSLNFFFQIDFILEISQMMDMMIADAKVVYSNLNIIPEEDLVTYFQLFEQSKQLMLLVLPSLLIISSFVQSILSFALSKTIMSRMKISFEKTSFKDFRIEKNGRLVIMIVLGIVTLGALLDRGNTEYYIMNFVNVFDKLLHINGMAFIWYLFEKKPNKTALKILSVIVYFVSPILGPLDIIRLGLGIIGFVDMYANFRKRIEARNQ